MSDRCHRKRGNTLNVRMRVDERRPDSAPRAAKGLGLQGSSMRPGRLELPPRLHRTRPSTLRYGCAWCPILHLRAFCPRAWTSWKHRTGCPLPARCHGRLSSGRSVPGPVLRHRRFPGRGTSFPVARCAFRPLADDFRIRRRSGSLRRIDQRYRTSSNGGAWGGRYRVLASGEIQEGRLPLRRVLLWARGGHLHTRRL